MHQNALHVLNVLETVPQVAYEGMVDMLEHAAFSNYIANAFRTDDWCCVSLATGSIDAGERSRG